MWSLCLRLFFFFPFCGAADSVIFYYIPDVERGCQRAIVLERQRWLLVSAFSRSLLLKELRGRISATTGARKIDK